MPEAEVKDARGMLCPEPLLIAKQEMEKPGASVVKILVDNAAARENITRLAERMKWSVKVDSAGTDFLLTLEKK